MSHSALIMSFETLFDPRRAGDMDADVGFRFARASYVVSIRDGRISVQRREPHHVDAIFTGEPTNIVAVIHGRVDPALVGVTIDGDAAVAKRFAGLFPLPAKVGES
jgi:predicted lipid carrier protein YhbT